MTCLLTAMHSAKHILCISIYKEFDKNKLKNKQNPWKYDSILISFARLSVKNPKLRNLPWITSVVRVASLIQGGLTLDLWDYSLWKLICNQICNVL